MAMKIELKVVQSAGIIGGTAAAGTIATNYAMRKTNWSLMQKGAIGGAIQVIAGALVIEKMPRIGMGLMAGGIAQAVNGATQQIRLSQRIAQLEGNSGTTSTTPTGTGTQQVTDGGTRPTAGLVDSYDARIGARPRVGAY